MPPDVQGLGGKKEAAPITVYLQIKEKNLKC